MCQTMDAPDMINNIPVEVLKNIFSQFDSSTRLNAMLTCKNWLSMLSSEVPPIRHLHVDLDSLSCNGRIVYKEHDTCTSICQCVEHKIEQGVFLREIFQLFGNTLDSLIVEDSLLCKSGEIVNDYIILVILRECSNYLQSLQFNLVDMGSVKLWTLAILARFCALRAVHFDSCRFPEDVSESFLLRILAPSFSTLETIFITNNSLITDKFALTVAKKCPNLKEFNVSGCSQVTALSAVAFSEAIVFNKDANPVNLDLRNTSFKSIEVILQSVNLQQNMSLIPNSRLQKLIAGTGKSLQSTSLSRHLSNPLLQCGPCWQAQAITLNIGFDRRAIVLENTEKNDLVLVVYI